MVRTLGSLAAAARKWRVGVHQRGGEEEEDDDGEGAEAGGEFDREWLSGRRRGKGSSRRYMAAMIFK